MRFKFLAISSYQSAILRPKVTGSAWMPWERPICGVILCSKARVLMTAMRRLMSEMISSPASFKSMAKEVSRMSEEVSPR